MQTVGIDLADWNEPDLHRRLCSADRFNDWAMALGLRLLNTLFSSVSASLSSVTRRVSWRAPHSTLVERHPRADVPHPPCARQASG
jgi:hypothetical protein